MPVLLAQEFDFKYSSLSLIGLLDLHQLMRHHTTLLHWVVLSSLFRGDSLLYHLKLRVKLEDLSLGHCLNKGLTIDRNFGTFASL